MKEPDWLVVGAKVAVVDCYRGEDRTVRFSAIAKILKRDVVLDSTDAVGAAVRFRRTTLTQSPGDEVYLCNRGSHTWSVSEERLYRAAAPEIERAVANIRRRNIETRAINAAQHASTKLTVESAQAAIDALQQWIDRETAEERQAQESGQANGA